MLRRLVLGFRHAVMVVALAVVAFLAAAAVGGLIPGRTADLPQGDTVEIALLYGPIHVDFLLPATDESVRNAALAPGCYDPAAMLGYLAFLLAVAAAVQFGFQKPLQAAVERALKPKLPSEQKAADGNPA